MKTLSEKIKLHIKSRGLTKTQYAAKLGYSRQHLQMCMRNPNNMGVKLARAISDESEGKFSAAELLGLN